MIDAVVRSDLFSSLDVSGQSGVTLGEQDMSRREKDKEMQGGQPSSGR